MIDDALDACRVWQETRDALRGHFGVPWEFDTLRDERRYTWGVYENVVYVVARCRLRQVSLARCGIVVRGDITLIRYPSGGDVGVFATRKRDDGRIAVFFAARDGIPRVSEGFPVSDML